MLEYNYLIPSLIINILIIIFFKKITKHFNILDFPDKKRKFQKDPVYLIGGTFLFVNIIFISIFNLIFNDFIFIEFTNNRENFAFMFGLFSFYLFGLYQSLLYFSSYI